jgi:hypothetical protein
LSIPRFLRAGSQFREKAQRYHNPILSNVLPAPRGRERAVERRENRALQSMEGLAPIC